MARQIKIKLRSFKSSEQMRKWMGHTYKSMLKEVWRLKWSLAGCDGDGCDY